MRKKKSDAKNYFIMQLKNSMLHALFYVSHIKYLWAGLDIDHLIMLFMVGDWYFILLFNN